MLLGTILGCHKRLECLKHSLIRTYRNVNRNEFIEIGSERKFYPKVLKTRSIKL